MNISTKKIITAAVLLASVWAAAPSQSTSASPDVKAFQDIKLLIFDGKWSGALVDLDDFISRYPRSPLFAQAMYHRSQALDKVGGREEDALDSYKSFLRLKDKSASLAEAAEIAVVDLAIKLYNRGDREYVREAEDRLDHPGRDVRYYAAIQLSYVKDKRIAEKSVPVLKEILAQEKAPDLLDRARIALFRVSPRSLEGAEEPSRRSTAPRMLRITVWNERTGKLSVDVTLPWALADLVLGALPESDKAAIRAEGYDIDRIIRELQSFKGRILEFRSEEAVIKIWIE
jgi:hypothetical protein